MSPLISTFAGAALRPYGFTTGTGEPPAAFELISTAYGTGSSGTITFSSIPSTFKHLEVRLVTKTSRTDQYTAPIFMTFNGDTANNYAIHLLYGNGSSVLSSAGTTRGNILQYFTATSGDPNQPSAGMISILDYSATSKYKTTRHFGGNATNTEPRIALSSGLWQSNSAISSITFTTSGGDNFTSVSRIGLYGVKG